jgi:hypothetical protein
VGDTFKWLKEGAECEVITWNGRVLGVELPASVVLKVTDTDPGVRGDTAQGELTAILVLTCSSRLDDSAACRESRSTLSSSFQQLKGGQLSAGQVFRFDVNWRTRRFSESCTWIHGTNLLTSFVFLDLLAPLIGGSLITNCNFRTTLRQATRQRTDLGPI